MKAQAILIEKLLHQLAGHRAHRFGACSETAEQLHLALETSEIAAAAMTARMKLPGPWGGGAPPAAWYRFSSDRTGEHPKDHLAGYTGWMHADGYARFEHLNRSGNIREVACKPMSDARLELVKLTALTDRKVFEREWAGFFPSTSGRPATPSKLVAGLLYPQHACRLSDEAIVARRVENPD